MHPSRNRGPSHSQSRLDLRVLEILASGPASKAEIFEKLGQKKVSGQLNKVMRDLFAAEKFEHTIPGKRNLRLQKYRGRLSGRS